MHGHRRHLTRQEVRRGHVPTPRHRHYCRQVRPEDQVGTCLHTAVVVVRGPLLGIDRATHVVRPGRVQRARQLPGAYDPLGRNVTPVRSSSIPHEDLPRDMSEYLSEEQAVALSRSQLSNAPIPTQPHMQLTLDTLGIRVNRPPDCFTPLGAKS